MTTRSNTAPLRRSRNSSKRRMRIIRAKCRVLSQLVSQPLEGCGNHKDCWVGGRELGSIMQDRATLFHELEEDEIIVRIRTRICKACKRLSIGTRRTAAPTALSVVSVPELCVARTMSSMGMTDRRSTMNHPLPAHNRHLEDARVLTRTRTRQNEAHNS